jgi:hypothetical protein
MKTLTKLLFITTILLLITGCRTITYTPYVELKKMDSYTIVKNIDELAQLFPAETKDLMIYPGNFGKSFLKEIIYPSIAFGFHYKGRFPGIMIHLFAYLCSKGDDKEIVPQNVFSLSSRKEEKAFVLFSKEELYQAGFLNDDNTTVKGDICIDAKMNDPEKTDKIDRFTITKEEMDKALEELESL